MLKMTDQISSQDQIKSEILNEFNKMKNSWFKKYGENITTNLTCIINSVEIVSKKHTLSSMEKKEFALAILGMFYSSEEVKNASFIVDTLVLIANSSLVKKSIKWIGNKCCNC